MEKLKKILKKGLRTRLESLIEHEDEACFVRIYQSYKDGLSE